MKTKIAAIMGLVLAMSATTLPAFAAGARTTNTQPQSAKQQPTQKLSKTGAQMHQQKWSLNDQGVKMGRLTPAEQAKFKQFKTAIVEQGLSPQAAAKKVGITKVSRLKSTTNQQQIRLGLSKKTSATLRVNERNKTVTVVKVGSNKPLQTLSKSTKARYQQRTTAGNQTRRPSLSQKTSPTPQISGQSKAVKANPAGSNVKPTPASSQNQSVLPR
jgi:hypothetical protein